VETPIFRRIGMQRAGIFLAAFLVATAAFAQQEAPKSGPEHKKLDIFVGSWSLEGDIKPSAMGPGGKVTQDQKCEWMEGNFFVVCRLDFKSPNMGSGSGLAIMGYSAEDKLYTYREFNSWGEADESKGTVDGDSWTWTSNEKMGSTMVKTRFVIKMTSPTAYTFTYETSPDGIKWTTVVDGSAAKK
jgi:hypothetical protein